MKDFEEENSKLREQLYSQTEKAIENNFNYNRVEKKSASHIEELSTMVD